MTNYLYRGTSLSQANEEEFADQRIDGDTSTLYKGRLDMHNPHATVPRETPVQDIDWYRPDGVDPEDAYLTDQQGVTGGVTGTIGTAIQFTDGIPIVLYLRESALNGTGVGVRYNYDFFDAHPGALAWVYGRSVSGEVHAEDEGLIGLTTQTAGGPAVWEWGRVNLNQEAAVYEDEREVLVFEDSIDIAGACAAVAITLEGRRTAKQALATFEGYHASPFADASDGNVNRMRDSDVLPALHSAFHGESAMQIDNLVTINLSKSIMGRLHQIPEGAFEWAYTDTSGFVGYDEVAPFLLGGDR